MGDNVRGIPISVYKSIPDSKYAINLHKTENPELPDWFKQSDAYKNNDIKLIFNAGEFPNNITDLLGFDVFLCLPEIQDGIHVATDAIALAEERNKLLIFWNRENEVHKSHILNLFAGRVSFLDDDGLSGGMPGLPLADNTKLLKIGGKVAFNYATYRVPSGPMGQLENWMSEEKKDEYNKTFTCGKGEYPLKGKIKRLPHAQLIDADIDNMDICTKTGGAEEASPTPPSTPPPFIIEASGKIVNEHILDFTDLENQPIEPEWFKDKKCLKVCVAAGDGWARLENTDIERLPEFDIYICMYNISGEPNTHLNIQYILDNYYHQKLICYLDTIDSRQLDVFAEMFKNRCQFIASDYSILYIRPDIYGLTLLSIGGKLIDYKQRVSTVTNPSGAPPIKGVSTLTPPEGVKFDVKQYTHKSTWNICTKVLSTE